MERKTLWIERNVYFIQIPISPDIWSQNIDPQKSIKKKKEMHDFPVSPSLTVIIRLNA